MFILYSININYKIQYLFIIFYKISLTVMCLSHDLSDRCPIVFFCCFAVILLLFCRSSAFLLLFISQHLSKRNLLSQHFSQRELHITLSFPKQMSISNRTHIPNMRYNLSFHNAKASFLFFHLRHDSILLPSPLRDLSPCEMLK